MRRRHLVVLVSAITLLAVVFVAVVSVAVVVNTRIGREQVRVAILKQLGAAVRGRVYVGEVTGGLLTSVTIDSLAIRDLDDSLFVSLRRVTLEYDPRDLFDRRLVFSNVVVEQPVLRIQEYPDGDWNYRRILRREQASRPGVPNVPGRGFRDFVILDSVTVRNGSFTWVRPWSPSAALTGAARDSAVRYALADSTREIRRAGAGFTHVYRWTNANGVLPHVRIAHPDSSQFGREFVFSRFSVDEQEPPFAFRNMSGSVRHTGDSVFFDIPRFRLPGSVGSGVGKVWWGSGLPVRYDVRIRGDTVALADIAWVYGTLPRTGRGSVDLHIRNNARNLSVMEYALTNLDVSSTRSRLLGAMTFAVGDPVLGVTDVDLRAAPVNFDLVRTLAGEPLPVDWQGDLIGTVAGPGGPLTNFVVDSSNITFRDAHVRGAVSRFSARGELDILEPALAVFHGFDVTAHSLDLRSIQHLYPTFVELGGTVSGRATLDSSWLDLRFSNADLSHSNGPGDPSRFAGSGRITWGEQYMHYDVALEARPLSMVMFSRAYDLGLKGNWSGPISARGRSDNLRVVADLTGPAGRITYDGTVDAEPLTIAAHGTGRVETLELSGLVDRDQVPPGWITGDYQLAVVGDTNDLATLKGSAAAQVERAEFDGLRVFPSRIAARFDDRRMFIDTLRFESTAGTVDAAGALGLGADRSDTLRYFVAVDSLGGLRSYIVPLLANGASPGEPDSLSGSFEVTNGTVIGSVRAMRVAGVVGGSNLVIRRDAGSIITGEFAVTDPFTTPTGSFSVTSRHLDVGGVKLDSLGFSMRVNEGRTGAFALGARAVNASTLAVQGEFAKRADDSLSVRLRTAALVADSGRWYLANPATFRVAGSGLSLDSLVVLNGVGGRVSLSGSAPERGRARFLLRADSLPLRDVGVIAQLQEPLRGWASLTVAGAGTSLAPVINAEGRLWGVDYRELELEAVDARASYASNRAQVQLTASRRGRPLLTADASLPMELRYFGARLVDDSLRGSLRTGQATLDLLHAFVPGIRAASGPLTANLDLTGTWTHPDVSGAVRVENGEATIDSLGIRLRGIQVDLALFGHADSLAIRRMVAWNGASEADSIAVSGHVAYRDFTNPVLALRLDARGFRAIDRRNLARLDVSTDPGGLTLRGPLLAATLAGGVRVDRGVYFLPDPELARKQTAELRTLFADTAAADAAQVRARSDIFDRLRLDNVRVTLGEDVSLRSTEADIRLAGALTVQRVRVASIDLGGADTANFQPVLDGTLRADRGTYTLNLLYGIQREFTVEQGGTIVFYPSVDLPPSLNVSALHVVRRPKQADLRIRVRLSGPLTNPIASLESAESYAMSQTDLVSHLLFGVPSFALADQEVQSMELAAQALLPTGQVLLSSQIGRLLGSFGEGLQIRAGTYDPDKAASGSTGQAIWGIVATTRIGRDFQVADNVFLSVTGGLCAVDRSNTGTNSDIIGDFANALSGKLEYRLSPTSAFTAGREPPASALNCGRSVTGRAFIPTPSQWGVALFKSWRF